MAKDYYDILGIDKEAKGDDIKKAFRKKAHQYHPDKSGGDAKKFKEVNEAYQVLSDSKKRSQYDQFGQTFDGGSGGQSGGFSGFSGFEDMFKNGFGSSNYQTSGASPFGDIFDDIFGGRSSQRQSTGQSKGEDLILELTLKFEEAALGTKRKLTYSRLTECFRCKGNKAEPGTKIETCSTCGGTGEVKDSQRTILGYFTQVRACTDCHGTGKKAEKECRQCRGQGVEKLKEDLEVKIPPGVMDGESLILRGKGNDSVGGISGDLYIRIAVRKHTKFRRRENDILYIQEIGFSQAALGETIEVPTLFGEVDLKVPAGIQSGDVLRMKNKGIQRGSGGRQGDQLVKIKIVTPSKLSKEGKEIFKRLKKIESKKNNKWFF